VLCWAERGVEEEMGCELAGPREGDWAAGLACFTIFLSFFFFNPTQSI
jgi:hypothetical protein